MNQMITHSTRASHGAKQLHRFSIPPDDPIRSIAAAVMADAMDGLLTPITVEYHGDTMRIVEGQRYRCAAAWMRSTNRTHPFAYLILCDLLEIDPENGRRVLNAMDEARATIYREIKAGTVVVKKSGDRVGFVNPREAAVQLGLVNDDLAVLLARSNRREMVQGKRRGFMPPKTAIQPRDGTIVGEDGCCIG